MAARRNPFIDFEAIDVIDYVDSSDESRSTWSTQDSPRSLSEPPFESSYSRRDSPPSPSSSGSPLDLSMGRPDSPYSPQAPQDWSPLTFYSNDDDCWADVLASSQDYPSPTSLLPSSPTSKLDWEEEANTNPFPSTVYQTKPPTCTQQHILCIDMTQSSDEDSSSVSSDDDDDE